MKKCLYLIMASIFLLFSCSNIKETINKKLDVVDLTEVLKNPQKATISKIANVIEYIQLQTNEKSLISKDCKFYANGNYILAVAFRKMLLFDRKTGNFIREIGEYGKSPGSYRSTLGVLPFNETKNTINAGGSGKNFEFSLDGIMVNSVKLPPSTFTIASINENYFAGFVPNFAGNEKTKLNIFTADGTIIKTFPNHLTAPAPTGMIVHKPNGWFYRWDRKLFFYELFNDTLFHVTPNELIPKYVFDMGKYLPPYEKQTSHFQEDEYFMFKSIHESSGFLFYSFKYEKKYYTMVYDKVKKEVFKSDYFDENGSGFINDIDHAFPFIISGVNKNNELIGYTEAYEVVQWFEKNPDKFSKLPPHLMRLKNLKKMDNPIVIIAELKD